MGLIYLDTCLLIYAVENHPVWFSPVREALSNQPADSFAISPLVKMECLVKPMRLGDTALQWRYESAMTQFAPLTLNEAVFVQAAQLRARFNLKTPDALHLACAQHHGCVALWTNDDRLAQAAYGLARNVLQ